MISQTVMAEICARSSGLCEQCGSSGDFRGLSIHHKRGRGMGGTRHEYTAEELERLCGKCHSERHHLREGND